MNNQALYDVSYGMYAIGVKDGIRDCGCIVNTIFQVSTIGPLIALSMNKQNYTCDCILKNQCFSVSVLPENIDSKVITQLGFQSGKDRNKWENIEHHSFMDLPIVNGAIGYFVCKVEKTMEAHTHVVFLARVIEAEKINNEKPMTYAYYHNVVKGSAPKNAPTYQPEEKWVCSVCGFVYDGKDFALEPDNYVCPVCGAKKEMFKKQER